MLQEILKTLFTRELTSLEKEIGLYQHEEKIWYTEKNIANSAGNLCLHLIGNLNAFIGTELGNTGYVRNRDLEFSQKDVPRAELISRIKETILVIQKTLDGVTAEQLAQDYPKEVFGRKMSTEYFLIHLVGHLNYHLGQVNYHRRLLD